ncbi:MAG TPA: methylated-DNA--[protein]-cysteine S-methyltransferase [Acidimicrobiales bacterium]|nr:methylated-DNA--[protein]-cysteine S-methyltransferase [Acidimicrobiales bacterium]
MTVRIAIDTPVGTLTLEGDDEALTYIGLPDEAEAVTGSGAQPVSGPVDADDLPAPVAAAAAQLKEYFAGQRDSFDIPLKLKGTDFQREVWLALAEIPYGTTISYADLARAVGRPRAFRAVGQANGANPLPIVLPCHRVVASGGRIGGYGGGLTMKRRLLDLEGVVL